MNALTPAQITEAPLPQVYESAKAALAQCETIDECKTWADKAEALASYAKQAADEELESMARRIRSRAIRNIGKLLEQIEPGEGARDGKRDKGTHTPLNRSDAARNAGLSKHQQNQAMRVAAVPEQDFEEAIEADKPATVTQLAERGTKKRIVVDHTGGRDPKIFNGCLHYCGDLTAAAKSLAGRNHLLKHMTQTELAEAQAAAEALREICEEIEVFQ